MDVVHVAMLSAYVNGLVSAGLWASETKDRSKWQFWETRCLYDVGVPNGHPAKRD